MTTPEQLAAQAEAVARVRIARINRDQAADNLKVAIGEAYDAGAAIKDIALAADLTRQRVWQIVNER